MMMMMMMMMMMAAFRCTAERRWCLHVSDVLVLSKLTDFYGNACSSSYFLLLLYRSL